jgi:hypothetical protein
MFWLAVRADGIGSDGVTVACALPEAGADEDPGAAPDAVPDELAGLDEPASGDGEGVTVVAEGVAVALADGLADALAGNSDWLAGTSSRKVLKIWLSWGWVHSTLAVSVGTTSERGWVGTVKNATLLDGRLRRLEARL